MGETPHDYDAVTLRCRRCGMSAIQGCIVCSPHPDYIDDDANS